ncbi:MAG: phosphopantetheine-binding protein [Firmicutes bacterium]|nr:phosphopantetheine-binding protein [Bacillota bacterium]
MNDTLGKIAKFLAEFKETIKPEDVKPASTFADLGLDSLDVVDLGLWVTEKFDIDMPTNIRTIGEAIDFIDKNGAG